MTNKEASSEQLNKERKNNEFSAEVFSEAASLLYYDKEELKEFFSPAEVEEINVAAVSTVDCETEYTIGDEQDTTYRMVAEDDEPYGK